MRETGCTAHNSDGSELGECVIEAPVPEGRIAVVRALVLELQAKLEVLEGPPTPEINGGIDFYQEVARFEIKLVKQALTSMRGNQRRAARLLNLNTNTLHTKIRKYRIELFD